MSHFTVLVVGNNPEYQLAPFVEEVEPGGEFAEFDDRTKAYRKEYEKEKVKAVKTPKTGEMINIYSDRYKALSSKTKEELEEEEVSFQEVYPTFEMFMNGWHNQNGPDPKTGGYGYWFNPNAKWDWYSLGGRWTGFMRLKKGAEPLLGQSGVFDNSPESMGKGIRSDQALKKDIDIVRMRMEAKSRAHAEYDRFERVTDGLEVPPPWDEFRMGMDIEDARTRWSEFDWVIAMRKNDLAMMMGDDHEYYCVNTGGREKFVQQQMDAAFSTFAILMNGEWYEKGEMGWFGMASNEKDVDDWHAEFSKLIDGLPDDTLLSVYDCHI